MIKQEKEKLARDFSFSLNFSTLEEDGAKMVALDRCKILFRQGKRWRNDLLVHSGDFHVSLLASYTWKKSSE
jgi:hypothetical protein